MKLESVWYESSPYVYVAGGGVSLVGATSLISVLFPLLLIGAATTIVRLRWKYRHQAESERRRTIGRNVPGANNFNSKSKRQ